MASSLVCHFTNPNSLGTLRRANLCHVGSLGHEVDINTLPYRQHP